MKILVAFVILTLASVAFASNTKTVVNKNCFGPNCRLYNEKVTEEDSFRKTLRGGFVKKQVYKKTYTPAR